ncbi:SpoIIE family protein phosphatase [Streptomyces sp. NPDC051940]|uniref:PP2C family protein-serine/threonine phosphatase n=1 Tax=Streptomyces sp. NPDC051940 TaxID=3155675 RepID=UPI00342189C7
MPSPLSPDRSPAAEPHDRGAVDALLEQLRRLRGGVDAVRDEAGGAEYGTADPGARWRRAVCDLADSQLDDLDAQLAQLREPRAAAPGRTAGSLLTRVGSAEWDLLTDRIDWSEELYAIFGRTAEEGPLSLDELPSAIAPADQSRLTAMVTDCLIDGRTIDGEFRVVRPDGTQRTVHMVGEPVLDPDGGTASMWAVLRDVSELRRSEQAMKAARDSLSRQEHRLAVELQEAVLPPWRGPLRFPHGGPAGLDLAVHFVPEPGEAAARSDWYDATQLPDGGTLLSVGDLAGRGATVTSGLAMLLGALRGMALSGVGPGPLLGWLNQLLEASAQPMLGSALCCRYDPATRTLQWAQAGHPPPLLFAAGRGRALDRPHGEVLGTGAQSLYGLAKHALGGGEVLVLHTAGLNAVLDPQSLAPAITEAPDAQSCLSVLTDATSGAPGACLLVARVTTD